MSLFRISRSALPFECPRNHRRCSARIDAAPDRNRPLDQVNVRIPRVLIGAGPQQLAS